MIHLFVLLIQNGEEIPFLPNEVHTPVRFKDKKNKIEMIHRFPVSTQKATMMILLQCQVLLRPLSQDDKIDCLRRNTV